MRIIFAFLSALPLLGHAEYFEDEYFAGLATAGRCGLEDRLNSARLAEGAFDANSGMLWGVHIRSEETTYRGTPGYNGCALVVKAILAHAGCTKARGIDASVDSIIDRCTAISPEKIQPGDIVYWEPKFWANFGAPVHNSLRPGGGKIAYRHVGIFLGQNSTMDNNSSQGRPRFGSFWRFQYEVVKAFRCGW